MGTLFVIGFFLGTDETIMNKKQQIRYGDWRDRKVPRNTVHLILATLVINILGLAMPLMMLQTYDRILPNHGVGTLVLLISGVGCAAILEVILRLARSYLTSWAGAVFEHGMSCRALSHMLNAETQSFEQQGSGAYIQKMAAITRLRMFYSGQALMTMVDLPFVLTFLALIAYIGGNLVYVPLALFVVFCVTAWLVGVRLKTEVREQDRIDKVRYNFLIETLTGIHTIKSQGLEKFFLRRNDRLQGSLSLAHFRVALSNSVASSAGMLFGQIMTVMVVTFGALKVIEGDLGTGGLAACILLSGRIMQPVQRALGLWTRFQNYFVDRQELQQIFTLPVPEPGEREEMLQPKGIINCRNMSFSYGGGENKIFDGLDLRVGGGESISFVGQQSHGKTTLLLLLSGLLEPTEGRITIDGADPHRIDPVERAARIGYLPEKGTIFNGSIMENLTIFGAVPEEDAMTAAKHLGIIDAVALLPNGFKTTISDNVTDPIPPGLKQRIAIARTLARRPNIIMFDNADRGLDREGYNLVFRTLGRLKGRITMLFVSDDRNILRLADQEYHIVNGKLQEQPPQDSKIFSVVPFRELRV